MAKTILGVDIGYDNLKLALLKGGRVVQTVSVPMPKNLLRDGHIVSAESMGELIRTTMKENGIRSNAAAFVIPNETIYAKNVVMPVMSADQLVYNLPFEFRDYITGEIREYVFDYAMISGPSAGSDGGEESLAYQRKRAQLSRRNSKSRRMEEPVTGGERTENPDGHYTYRDGGAAGAFDRTGDIEDYTSSGVQKNYGEETGGAGRTPTMELLAVCAPRAYMEEIRGIMRKAGMKLEKAAPALCTFIHLIRARQAASGSGGREYCILDLGYQSIRMHVYRGERYMFTRVLDMGLSMLDEVIAESFGVDIHLAHTYLMTNYEDCLRSEECETAYGNIAMELMRVLNFYRYSNPDSDIREVWLCGGGAVNTPLREAIRDSLDMDVLPASELVPGGELVENCNSFVQAVGIAIE